MNRGVIRLNDNVQLFHRLFPLLSIRILQSNDNIVFELFVQPILTLCCGYDPLFITATKFGYQPGNKFADDFLLFAMLVPLLYLTAKGFNIIDED